MGPPSPARQPVLARALGTHAPQLPDETRLVQGDVVAVLRNPGDGEIFYYHVSSLDQKEN